VFLRENVEAFNVEDSKIVKDTVSLLACSEEFLQSPECPVKYLLENEQRSSVAKMLNSAILEFEKEMNAPALDCLIGQLQLTQQVLWESSGVEPPQHSLEDMLHSIQ